MILTKRLEGYEVSRILRHNSQTRFVNAYHKLLSTQSSVKITYIHKLAIVRRFTRVFVLFRVTKFKIDKLPYNIPVMGENHFLKGSHKSNMSKFQVCSAIVLPESPFARMSGNNSLCINGISPTVNFHINLAVRWLVRDRRPNDVKALLGRHG